MSKPPKLSARKKEIEPRSPALGLAAPNAGHSLAKKAESNKNLKAEQSQSFSMTNRQRDAMSRDDVAQEVDPELLAICPELRKNSIGSNSLPLTPQSRAKPVSKGQGSSLVPRNPFAVRLVSTLPTPKQQRKRPRLTLDDRDIIDTDD